MAEPSSPRNTLIGHLVAVLAGALSLEDARVVHQPEHPRGRRDARPRRSGGAPAGARRVGVAVPAASHPPAGTTALIVRLGLPKTPTQLAMIVAGVVLLTVAAWIMNRPAGAPVPVWRSGD